MKNKNRKIILASVLKPCTDVRMYEKLAKTLSSFMDADIYMLGHQSVNPPPIAPKFYFKPIFSFQRTSALRFFTEIIFLFQLFSIKPSIVIVSTYELLFSSVIYKWLTGAKIYYDVQENYSLNIKTGTLKPLFIRELLSLYVSLKEKILVKFINHFLLAEACYMDELAFMSSKATVIANKVDRGIRTYRQAKPQKLNICITGTLGKTYGTVEAIELLKKASVNGAFDLTIIGYCIDPVYLSSIKKAIEGHENMLLIGGSTMVLHTEILQVISKSHISVMFYENNLSFKNKIPTKFYECIALNTQIIASNDISSWQSFLDTYEAGLVVNTHIPRTMDGASFMKLLNQLKNKPCLSHENIFFDSEKLKLQKIFMSYRNEKMI